MMALALVRVNDRVFANEGTGIWLADWTIPRLRFAVAALGGKTGAFHDPTFRKSLYRYQIHRSSRALQRRAANFTRFP